MKTTIRKFQPGDFQKLVVMYNDFEPKGSAQGLPPYTTELTHNWLHGLCGSGCEQFVAETNGRIIGHATLCRLPRRSEAELAIFVHQDFRGQGLGGRLLRGVLNYGCKHLCLARVRLVTLGSNPVALRLFEDVGFHPVNGRDPWTWEIEMERPSHCVHCKGAACSIFNQPVPATIELPVRKEQSHANSILSGTH